MAKKYIAQKTMTQAATIALGRLYVPKGVQVKSSQASRKTKSSATVKSTQRRKSK